MKEKTYKQKLKEMSNEELVDEVLYHRDILTKKRELSEAELLSRLDIEKWTCPLCKGRLTCIPCTKELCTHVDFNKDSQPEKNQPLTDEVIEEEAVRQYPTPLTSRPNIYVEGKQEGFIEGAEWARDFKQTKGDMK